MKSQYVPITENTKNILLYAMTLAVALGFNDFIQDLFEKYFDDSYIWSKLTYVILLLIATITLAHYTQTAIKN